jgi:hypothetical protein
LGNGIAVSSVALHSRTGFTHFDSSKPGFLLNLWAAAKYFGKNPVSDYPCIQNYWYINNINAAAKCTIVKELETAIMKTCGLHVAFPFN